MFLPTSGIVTQKGKGFFHFDIESFTEKALGLFDGDTAGKCALSRGSTVEGVGECS